MIGVSGRELARRLRTVPGYIGDLVRRTTGRSLVPGASTSDVAQLFGQLEREFGNRGHRAVQFLQTGARQLRRAKRRPAPRDAEIVAYCIREALSAIQKSVGGYDHPAVQGNYERFSVVSRDVVAAAEPLRAGAHGDEEIDRLLDAVARLEKVHGQPTEREDELTRLMLIRSGVPPVAGQGSAVETFNEVGRRANAALHAQIDLNEAAELYTRATSALMALFHPPTRRLAQLEQLADQDEPGPAERTRLEQLVGTPHHLAHFFRNAKSSAWLRLLEGTPLVALPNQPGAPWPVVRLIDRHANRDDETIAAWLNQLADTVRKEDHVIYVADAARRFGRGGDAALLKLARRSGHNLHVEHALRRRFEAVPAAADLVTRAGDYLLDPAASNAPWMDRIMRRYLTGIDADNGVERLEILTYKLHKWLKQDGELILGPTRGSVADQRRRGDERRLVLRAWTQAAQIVLDIVDLDHLVSLTARLPDEVGVRLRSWLLAQVADVDADRLVFAVADTFQRVLPGPDEARLVDRALQAADGQRYLSAWRDAVGAPPALQTVIDKFHQDADLSERLLRMAWWATLLPDEIFHDWQQQFRHVQAQVGPIDRSRVQRAPTRPRVGSWRSTSPMTLEQISAMEPLEAAEAIGRWTPPEDPSAHEDPGELGYTLQQAVETDGERWMTVARDVIVRLGHPMYVRYLIEGLTRSGLDTAVWGERLAGIAAEVMGREGDVAPLGDGRDSDHDWRWATDAAVSLIRHLAATRADLGRQRDRVWDLLLRLAEPAHRPDEDEGSERPREPLDEAANDPTMRALDAALSLAWSEADRGKPVEPQLLALLDRVLAVNGVFAHAWRALLATHVGRLARFAPAWLSQHAPILFGPTADPELRQTAVDALLRFSRDGGRGWLEEHHSAAIDEALKLGVEAAAEFLLHQMLRGESGKGPATVVARLLRHNPAMLSGSASMLLPDEDDQLGDLNKILEFWAAAVDQAANRDALYGFGWFADLRGIPDEEWAARMLATTRTAGGDLDVPHRIAERCLEVGATSETLELLLILLRGTSADYERYDIATAGAELLQQEPAPDEGLTGHRQRLHDAILEYGFGEQLSAAEGRRQTG